jgi:hypothetical protein
VAAFFVTVEEAPEVEEEPLDVVCVAACGDTEPEVVTAVAPVEDGAPVELGVIVEVQDTAVGTITPFALQS